jgi:pimeloyl-ACP methyl ester carboxylesterase
MQRWVRYRLAVCYHMPMKQCAVVTFVTPGQYQLNGLWFGPEKARRGFIVTHGLSSSVFSQHDTLTPLVDDTTMVLFFNNRGHDKIGGVRKLLPETKKGYETQAIGATHEVFAECVDDIQGAVNFLKAAGVEDIYLVGHSTGCQKSIYYLSQKGNDVKGVVLLCPMSDYAYYVVAEEPAAARKAVDHARRLVNADKPHELLPFDVSEDLLDAQRYLSLYTPDSIEEIFTYSQPGKVPETLQKVSVPILAVLAEHDEYADRPAADIGKWFENQSQTDTQIGIVKDAMHNLADHGDDVVTLIENWVEQR